MRDASPEAMKNPDDGAPVADPGTPYPYEPPAVLFVERLEVQASVCTPGKANSFDCTNLTISS